MTARPCRGCLRIGDICPRCETRAEEHAEPDLYDDDAREHEWHFPADWNDSIQAAT